MKSACVGVLSIISSIKFCENQSCEKTVTFLQHI